MNKLDKQFLKNTSTRFIKYINSKKMRLKILKLLKDFTIYKNYPVVLPFIGENYGEKFEKCLFIGESHYLPKEFYPTNYYTRSMYDFGFTDEDKNWLNTNQIIMQDVIEGACYAKSHNMYKNFGKVFAEVFGCSGYQEALSHTAFYNYFLRPAEIPGKSINATWEDRLYSYEHLVKLIEVIDPDKIIFLSSLARQSFHQVYHSGEKPKVSDEIYNKIFKVQHPTSSWWNRKSKINGDRTGRQYLEHILKEL